MNKTIYYRNLAVFALFVAILFAAPFVFAETSAPNYICLDNANIRMHNRTDLNQINGTLGRGTIIQLPDAVAEHIDVGEDGQVNMSELRTIWHGLARRDRRLFPPLVERGRLYNQNRRVYPVKIVHSENRRINTSGRDSVGYISLAQLFRSGSYHTCRVPIRNQQEPGREEPPAEERPITVTPTPRPLLEPEEEPAAPSGDADFFFVGGDEEGEDETTVNDGIGRVRPQMRPPIPTPRPDSGGFDVPDATAGSEVTTPDFFLNNTINCANHGGYRSRNWTRYSCLRNLNLIQRAELVMSDVNKINRERPEFQLDPRISICIAKVESGLHPNALGGTPDYGMYQVTNGTGNGLFNRSGFRSVVDGFEGYRNWSSFRTAMQRSTLAQADIHHAVLYSKANQRRISGYGGRHTGRLTSQMNEFMRSNRSALPSSLVQNLAWRYNGLGGNINGYGEAVSDCYSCVTRITTKSGRVTTSSESQLERCLNKTRY